MNTKRHNTVLTNAYSGQTLGEEIAQRRRRGINSFSGNTFIDEQNKGLSFQMALKNTDTKDHRIALFPGDLQSVEELKSIAGVYADAIAVNGDVLKDDTDTNVIVTCNADNLAYIQRFLCKNPTRISRIQMTADDQSQFNKTISVTQYSPLRKDGSRDLRPMSYKVPGDNNDNMVIIDFKHLQLDDQSCLDIVLGAGREVYLTFFVAASNNSAYTLDAQARELIGE